jgi:hypothetical protein
MGDFGILVQQKNTETDNLEQLLPAEKENLPPPPLLEPLPLPGPPGIDGPTPQHWA